MAESPQDVAPGGGQGAGSGAPALATMRREHRRLATAVAALGVVLLAALLLYIFTAGGEAPPATGAAALVPADALLYVHLSTDGSRPAVRRMDTLLGRLPDRGASVDAYAGRMIAIVGGSTATQYGRDIRPWLGREAAFALLNSSGSQAGSVLVLDVGNRSRARAFLAREGAQAAGRYHGVALLSYPTGAELAFVGHYLVIGVDAGVRASIDTASGHTPALASASAYAQATADAPDGRVLDAYVSAAGVTRVLAARPGVLGAVGALAAEPGLLGTALSVSAETSGVRVHVHSALRSGQGGAPGQPFTPSLADVLPSGSTLMVDAQNLSAAAPRVLRAMAQVGLLGAVPDLLHRVGAALAQQGFRSASVLGLFGGETAVALAAGTGTPALVIVTRTDNEAAARVALANLNAPLTQLFSAPSAGPGVVPEESDVQVGGVTAHQLQLGPGLQLDYAVFHGLVVVATSLRGIGDVAARRHALSDDPSYQRAVGDQSSGVTSLGFADFSQLLSLAEQTSLPHSAGFLALQPDLRRIRAVGVSSKRGEADTTAELFLQIP